MAAIPYAGVTYRIIGAAMRVHNALGPGLKESVYQRALSVQLAEEELAFESEKPVDIFVDGVSVGLLYLDHLVEGAVIVEEKALSHQLTGDEVAQVITYLAATGLKVGLLINFERRRLEYRRILAPRKLDDWQTRIRRYVWLPTRS